VAAALAHLWRRAPLELLDYVADFACEHEIRLNTARRMRRGSQLFYTNYDDAAWSYIIEGDVLDDAYIAIRLLRGEESILLVVPGLTNGEFYFDRMGQVRISRKYVVVPVGRNFHVFRREDGAPIRSWEMEDGAIFDVGDELCITTTDRRVQLGDLATGDVLDEWRRSEGFYWDGTAVAIDARDAAAWIPGTRCAGHVAATPGFRVPIVNRRFMRHAQSHCYTCPSSHELKPFTWRSVCLRGDWVYLASESELVGIHANGTQVRYGLDSLLSPHLISTPRTMIVLLTACSPDRSRCEMIRFTGGDESKH